MIRKGVPPIFYLLSGLTGMVSSMILFYWFRQFTLLFGIHMISVATLLISGFLCLALGSYLFGKLADKTSKTLHIILIFFLIIVLFIFSQSWFFNWISNLYLEFIRLHNPGIYGLGLLRLILIIIFMLIPSTLLAGIFPMLIRSFIRHISSSGKYMSATVLSVSLGIISGLWLSVTLLNHEFHANSIVFAGILVCLSISTILIVHIYKKQTKGTASHLNSKYEREKKNLRFKKKKVILETGTKLTRAMLYVYVVQSSIFASMLLLSFRLLINYSQVKPVFFYCMIITNSLAGIAIGSILYNRIAEKPVNKYLTLATLQIIAGLSWLLSFALLSVFARVIVNQMEASQSLQSLLFKEGLLFTSFLFIPSVINGISFPIAGKLYPKRLQHIGNTFGQLGGLMFLSLITGIVITSFILIPLVGLERVFVLLALMIFLSGIYLVFRDSRLIRGFRMGYAFMATVLFVVVFIVLRSFSSEQKDPEPSMRVEGSMALAFSTENKDRSRAVYLNGNYYFGMDVNSRKEQVLSASIPLFLNPHIHSSVVVGFGSGLTASVLNEYDVDEINIIEAFPEILRLSSTVFADDNNDILTSANVNIYTEDGRSYLFRSVDKYDLITSGIDQTFHFPSQYTAEFYNICKQHLTEKGLLCQVLSAMDLGTIEFIMLCKTASSVFSDLSVWYLTPEKILLVCSMNDLTVDFCRSTSLYNLLDTHSTLSGLNIPNKETFLAHLMLSGEQLAEDFQNVTINNDNHPVLQYNMKIHNKGNEILPLFNRAAFSYFNHINFKGCDADSIAVINEIKRVNQSLLQQAPLSSSMNFPKKLDFFEPPGSLFPQYL